MPLLLRGPTGAGKSLFVEYFIHKFISEFGSCQVKVINCAAIPRELIESELFGYVKGSHSKADNEKRGILEFVNNGILVLEEVGEMPKYLQAKLLTVIETNRFTKVGGLEDIEFNGQIVATTNVRDKSLRDDFRYRFEVFLVPPVHARRGDVLYYIEHFDNDLIGELPKDCILSILSYAWHGNAREIARCCGVIRENIASAIQSGLMHSNETRFTVPLFEEEQFSALTSSSGHESRFSLGKARELAKKFDAMGIETKNINKLLKSGGLTFGDSRKKGLRPLSRHKTKNTTSSTLFGYFDVLSNVTFDEYYKKFIVFCQLFFQDACADYDVLDFKDALKSRNYHGSVNRKAQSKHNFEESTNQNEKGLDGLDVPLGMIMPAMLNLPSAGFPIHHFARHLPLDYQLALVDSLRYLTKDKQITFEDVCELEKYYEANPADDFLRKVFGAKFESNSFDEIRIENISLNELRYLYYETLCSALGTSHGYQKKIAKIAGLTEGRVSQVLDKNGLSDKFKKLNYMPRKRLAILK